MAALKRITTDPCIKVDTPVIPNHDDSMMMSRVWKGKCPDPVEPSRTGLHGGSTAPRMASAAAAGGPQGRPCAAAADADANIRDAAGACGGRTGGRSSWRVVRIEPSSRQLCAA